MARPKKERELRHSHQVMLRLTDTEYDIIKEHAGNANLPLAEYARKQIMNKRVITKYEIVANVPEWKRLISEFGRIGNNLNQIARYFNQGGIHYDPFTFDTECMELNAHFHKNQTYNEIKSHHYIISFDPKDREENGHRNSDWNMPEKIFPDIRLWSVLTWTVTTEAEIFMSILSSTVSGNMT